MKRRGWLSGGCVLMCVAMLRFTGCGDTCDDAVEQCKSCDLEKSTCEERFRDAKVETCQDAINRYDRDGCGTFQDTDCDGDTTPAPTPY